MSRKKHITQRKRPLQAPKSVRLAEKTPARPLKRRRRTKQLWIIGASGLLLVLAAGGFWIFFGSSGLPFIPAHHMQPTPTPTPSPTLVWSTLATFTASGLGTPTNTNSFTVTNDTWQIAWNCQGINGVDKTLYIAIYHPDGSLFNAGAQLTCPAAQPLNGSTQESGKGTYYLNIDSDTSYTVTVNQKK